MNKQETYLSYILSSLRNPRKVLTINIPLSILVIIKMVLIAYTVTFYFHGVTLKDSLKMMMPYILIASFAEGWILTKPIEEKSSFDNLIIFVGLILSILGIVDSINYLHTTLNMQIAEALLKVNVVITTIAITFVTTFLAIGLGSVSRYLKSKMI
jgi:hypothetical protein